MPPLLLCFLALFCNGRRNYLQILFSRATQADLTMLYLSFIIVFFSQPFASAAEFTAHGYLRAGTGTNGKGAKQECFVNRGSPTNELRLGNECAIYGESAFRMAFPKSSEDAPRFSSQVRLAYFPPGNSSFEDSDSDGRDVNIVEAFAEAEGVEGTPISIWAGKRFYRDVDVHIFDWYYYGQMNGNGAGIGNIPFQSGKLALAWLVETGSTRTNVGKNSVQVLDLRVQNWKLSDSQEIHFWAAYGFAPGSSGLSNNLQYASRSGFLLGTRWRKMIRDGFYDVALIHGRSLLEGLNVYGNALAPEGENRSDAYRWRLVQDLAWKINGKFGLLVATGFDHWNPKKSNVDSRGTWWAVGLRPIYFFTDHLQLASEIGHSQIHIRDERTSGGSGIGPRTLSRVTLAPQYSLGNSLWARPAIRVFYSQSFWNQRNRESVAVDAPSFAGSTSGRAFGVQTEVWF